MNNSHLTFGFGIVSYISNSCEELDIEELYYNISPLLAS